MFCVNKLLFDTFSVWFLLFKSRLHLAIKVNERNFYDYKH